MSCFVLVPCPVQGRIPTTCLFVSVSLLALLLSGSAQAGIISPNAPIAGQSQLDHAHKWVNVMTNLSAAKNPILDSTGDQAFRGQVGSVLYLAGTFGPSSNRSITVAPGTTLFFPLLTGWADNTNGFGLPPTTLTAQEWLDIIGIPPSSVQNLFVTINGQPVAVDLYAHRQTTDPNNPYTNVFQSADNLYTDFGADATLGTGVYPSAVNPTVVDGYWVGLTLPRGVYTISFGGENIDADGNVVFSQNNTFQVNVAIPEPASLAVFGLVLSAAGLRLRSKGRRKGSH